MQTKLTDRFQHILLIHMVFMCIHLTGTPSSAQQPSLRLTMDDAVALAIEQNTMIAETQYQTSGARYYINEVKANRLPKIVLNGSYSHNIERSAIFLPEALGLGGVTRIGAAHNFGASADLVVPVYSRLNVANLDYANAQWYLQREVTRGVKQEVINEVKKSYLALQMAFAVVAIREKRLENAVENLCDVKDRMTAGTATGFDQASAHVGVTMASNGLLEAENAVTPAESRLKVLLGLPLETALRLDDSIALTAEELSVSEDRDQLLIGNSLAKQRDLAVSLADAEKETARAAWFPQVSIVGSYQVQSQENHFDLSRYRWIRSSFLGVNLQYTLFDGSATRNRVRREAMQIKAAAAEHGAAIESNRAEWDRLMSALMNAHLRIFVQYENTMLAALALALAKERFNYGKGTFLEVSNAEAEYTQATLGHLEAIRDYKLAYYDYELLIGKDFP